MAIGNPINLTSNVEGKSISVSATAGQTQFTVTGGYRINQISVYRNGVRLVDGRDFTATDGSIVTLLSAASVDDVVEFQVFDDFRVSDALNVNSGGTVNGDVTVNGALTVSSTFTGTATTATNAQGLTGSPDIAVTNITAGIITATTFSGNGSALTGVASTDNIITGTAATFTSDVNIADSIIHVGDTNTKIRFPAADTFTVETAGSEALRVDSSGRIGINTTPGTLLELKGESSKEATITFNRQPVQGTNDGIIGEFLFENATDSVALLAVKRESAADDAYFQFATQATGGGLTEKLRIDSSGRLLIGSTSARANTFNASAAPQVQVEGTNANLASIGIFCSANDTDGGRLLLAHQRSGGVGGNTIVNDDDLTGSITFQGNDGNEFVESAAIKAEIDNAPAANDMPGRLIFATTADGAASASERLRITSTGRIGINVNNPDSYNSAGNNLVLGDTGNNSGMTIVTSTTNNGHIFFADGTASGAQNRGIIKYEHGNDAMAFNTAETERLRLTSGGDLLVGHGSVITNMKFGGSGDFGSHAEIIGANKGFANGLAILNYDASATIPAILKLATSRNDTAGSNTIVGNSGDNCASIQFMGNDGTRFIDLARIDGVTDGTPGANDMPGRLSFFTTADGASVVTERMRIHNSGVVSFNNGIELGSGLDATAANTLEDYEEGTFTPTANGFTVSGTTTMTGKYVKIGQLVTIGIKFANTGTIAYGVSCNIASLPFTMAAGTEAHGLIGMLQNSNSASFNSNIAGTQCKLDGEGGSRFFVGSFTTTSSGTQLLFGGSYISNQ